MSDEKSAIDLMVEAMDAANPPSEVTDETGQVAEVEEVKAEDPDSVESDTGKDITSRLEAKAFKLREQKRQLKEQNAALQAELAALKGKTEAPDILDFENEEEYDKALKKHEEQSKSKATVDIVLERARDTLLEQHEEWESAPEDWMEVVSDNKLPYDREMLALFADLDNGAEVMYALAKDEKALASITSKISPVKRGLALDKFAESLKAESGQDDSQNEMALLTRNRKPNVSAIAPVGGTSRGKGSLESLSVEDHLAAVRNQRFF